MTEMNENTDGLVASAEETAREAALTEVQFNLGNTYATGDGVPQDDAVAVYWYREAADQGDAKAQYNLGVMYENGRGAR
jgi:uncharacterized protein